MRNQFANAAREPLLHFLFAGLLIFVAWYVLTPRGSFGDGRIVIDESRVERLARQFETQVGRVPTVDELDAMVDAFVFDEILYREAIRLDLGTNDEIVRRRLIQKAEFLFGEEPENGAITGDDLRNYFDANSEEFMLEANVTFEHRFFSIDRGGQKYAMRRAQGALATLQAGSKRALNDDRFPLDDDLGRMTRARAEGILGQTPIVDVLFSAEVGMWLGPTMSGYGVHLVRVTNFEPQRLPAFEAVTHEVRDAVSRARMNEANGLAMESMRARYEIVRAYERPAP